MTLKMYAGDIADVLKAVLFSVLFSLAAVLIFAVIVQWTQISQAVIVPVNIAIKILSVAAGCLIGIRHGRLGLVKGLLVGLFFALATYLVYSAINGSFRDNPMTLYDVLCAIAAGVIGAVVAVNLRAHAQND